MLCVVGLVLVLLSGCGQNQGSQTDSATDTTTDETTAEARGDGQEASVDLLTGLHHVKLEIAGYGNIVVELDADAAPITVTNFINLVNEGFYDGLTFHRIIDGFMIQGGDPQGTGMGGSDTQIKGEFANNGVDNPISHVRGTISMARAQDPNSGSSQFFIVHQDSLFLDDDYAGFGHVTEGMDVVDALATETPVTDGNGSVSRENQPVITKAIVLD